MSDIPWWKRALCAAFNLQPVDEREYRYSYTIGSGVDSVTLASIMAHQRKIGDRVVAVVRDAPRPGHGVEFTFIIENKEPVYRDE